MNKLDRGAMRACWRSRVYLEWPALAEIVLWLDRAVRGLRYRLASVILGYKPHPSYFGPDRRGRDLSLKPLSELYPERK